MVRVTAIAKPASKALPSGPPIAGRFAKAPAKHTNDSKFTGKFRRGARGRESRSIPESKSRDKAKGAWKLKSCDVLLNHRLVAWRLVDAGTANDEEEEGRRRRLSATEMVEKLYANCNTFNESSTMEEEEEEGEQEAERDVEAEKEFNGGDEERDETDGDAVAGVSRECAEAEGWILVEEM